MAIVSEPIAVVSGLSVTYRVPNQQPVRALSQATLAIARGERIGILGSLVRQQQHSLPLSCGPSHPMHATTAGSVRFQAVDLLALPETQLRRIRGKEIALIPQDPSQALNPVISVGDQIAEKRRARIFGWHAINGERELKSCFLKSVSIIPIKSMVRIRTNSAGDSGNESSSPKQSPFVRTW